jgi:hypothetical protein
MKLDDMGYPKDLTSGVRCGNHERGRKVYHDEVATVAFCYATSHEQAAQQAAELAVEQAYERHLEDKGWYEVAAQADYERRNGVIPFDVAMRQASNEDGSWRNADLENGPGWTGPF